MYKKGDVESSTIVGVIVAILGFAVVLIFLLNILDVNEQSKEEICRLSVLSRATAPESANTYVPLQCSVNKICFTTNNENCKEFIGYEDVQKISLPKDPKKAADIIEAVSADKMLDCWETMGEGQLSLYSGGMQKYFGLESSSITCTVCARLALNVPDEKLKNNILNEIDLKEYMRTTQIHNSPRTYLNAFSDDGINNYVKTPEKVSESISIEETEFKKETDELSIVFTQIAQKNYSTTLNNLAGAGATIAGGAFITPIIGKPALKLATTGPGVVAIGVSAVGLSAYSLYNVRQGQSISAGYCGEFSSTNEQAKQGCSVIQILPYDISSINNICNVVEGNQ